MRGSKRITKGTPEKPERWELRVYDRSTGRYVSETVSAGSTREADTRLADLVARVTKGQVSASQKRYTLAEVAAQWFKRKEEAHEADRLSDATLDQYAWALRYITSSELGSRKVKTLVKPTELEDFYHRLAHRLSAKSVAQISGTLYQVLRFAHRRDYVRVNVAALVEDRPKLSEKPVTAPPDDDVRRFLEVAEEKNFPYFAHVLVSATSGGRRGEVNGLRKCDVLFDSCEVWFRVNVTKRRRPVLDSLGQPIKGLSRVVVKDAMKSVSGRRRVTLGEGAMSVLRELVQRLDARARELRLSEYPSEGYLFSPDPLGESPYHPDSINARFRKLCHAAGIDVTPHQLRHYAATQVAPFLTETEMMGRFGWKTPLMVRRYAEYRHAKDAEAAAAVEKSLRLVVSPDIDAIAK